MAETGTPQIDDMPEERESPVRHAHAVRASRHGRASTPGYLGLPAEEDQGHGVDIDDEDDEQLEGGDEEGQRDDDERHDDNPRSRAPRARGASKSSGKRKSSTRVETTSSRTSARRSTRGESKQKQSGKAEGSRRKAPAKSRSSSAAKPRSSSAQKTKASKSAPRAKSSGSSEGKRKTAGSRKKGSSARSAAEPAAERTKSAASTVGNAISSAASLFEGGGLGSLLDGGSLRRKAAKEGLHLAALLARHAARAGGRAATRAVSRAGAAGADALLERAQRMPIQQSIDVAVPTAVAWEQWMEFTYFPEGTHRVVDVERDGDTLEGELDGLTSREWEAEIIDERECESFAWRSTKGSDSAGLVTFHELAERLTRIELNLDVRPTDLAEAAGLALRLADHRVRSELRRFKAHAELLSPDIYDELLESSSNGAAPEHDEEPEHDDESSEE